MKKYSFLWFTVLLVKGNIYTGLGYQQGIGFDIGISYVELFFKSKRIFKIITDIHFETETEWLEKLKDKLK